ncbi:MAG: hypothetical protein ACOCRK_05435 [bacterium]
MEEMVTKDILTKEDIKFLKELGTELKTQDHMGTAKPLFHQIRDWEYEYGYDPDYSEGVAIIIGDDYEPFHTLKEAIEHIEEWYEPEEKDLEELRKCYSFLDIEWWCTDRGFNSVITGYQKKYRSQNAFLTRKACRKHIEQNYYHYQQGKDTICYTDHGWRNPELKKLLEIVEKFAD